MPKQSAGLLMVRVRGGGFEVLLVHPGGPFWKNKDAGAWSIPKGEHGDEEDALAAARREFKEETGLEPQAPFVELVTVRQRSGKTVRAWAFAGDCDPSRIHSNTLRMEWPPGSGRQAEFAEVDRAAFFSLPAARDKLNPGQVPLLDDLLTKRSQLGLDSG